MPIEQSVEEFFPVSQASKEKEIIKSYINEIVATGDKLAGIRDKLSLGGLGFGDSKKAADELNVAIKEQGKTLDNYNKQLQSIVATQKAATEAAKQATEAKKQETEQSKQQTESSKQQAASKIADAKSSTENTKQKEIETNILIKQGRENDRQAKLAQQRSEAIAKAAAKEDKAIDELSNDYLQLSKAYAEASLKAKNLALQQGSGTPAAKEALSEANLLGAKLKEVDALTGTFNRNVGNYAGGIADYFGKAFGYVRTLANILPGLGISGIFLLGYEAIIKALDALNLFDTATERNINTQRQLNDIRREEIEINKQVADTYKSTLNVEDQVNATTQSRQNALNIANAENKSRTETLKLEKGIADARALVANQQFNEKGGFDKQQEANNKLITSQQALLDRQKELQNVIKNGSTTIFGGTAEADKEDIERAQKNYDEQKKIVNDQIKLYNEIKGINEENANAIQAQQEKETEIIVYNAEQRRKIILETAKINADIEIAEDQRVLNNEKSNLNQRLKAVKDAASARRQAALAEYNDVLADPSTASSAQRVIAAKNYAKAIMQINKDAEVQIFNERENYRKRDLIANQSILELRVNANIDANNKIADNEKLSLSTRLLGLSNAYQEQKNLIDAQYEYQKKAKPK